MIIEVLSDHEVSDDKDDNQDDVTTHDVTVVDEFAPLVSESKQETVSDSTDNESSDNDDVVGDVESSPTLTDKPSIKQTLSFSVDRILGPDNHTSSKASSNAFRGIHIAGKSQDRAESGAPESRSENNHRPVSVAESRQYNVNRSRPMWPDVVNYFCPWTGFQRDRHGSRLSVVHNVSCISVSAFVIIIYI